MKEFKSYHPFVTLIYFVAILGFSMVFMNPVMLTISLISGFTYSLILNGTRVLKFNFLYMLPVVVLTAVINPIFNHEGATVLWRFPNGNPLTKEAILYGISSALMLWSIICHFSCFNQIMTEDKIVYLFGRVAPSFSVILTMILRFVPNFKIQLRKIREAQHNIGNDISQGAVKKRGQSAVKILSVMISWSFENAIETADSMKSRGYGLKGRTAYSNVRMTKYDAAMLIYILILSGYVITLAILGVFEFEYYPTVKGGGFSPFHTVAYGIYSGLFAVPILIEIWEVLKWKKLKSRI